MESLLYYNDIRSATINLDFKRALYDTQYQLPKPPLIAPYHFVYLIYCPCQAKSIKIKPMAIISNFSDPEFRGHIDKKVVIRQYSGDRVVLSVFPDMSKVVPSETQKKDRLKFKEVQAAALLILADPEIKAFYKSRCKPGQRPHNLLIAEMLKEDRPRANDIFTGVHFVSR